MLDEAALDLQKYIDISKKPETYAHYLESVKFFAEYYKRAEAEKIAPKTPEEVIKDGDATYRITIKPRALYTDEAREKNVQGTIRLMVGLGADKTVKHIMIIKSLGFGLDENAIHAARQIQFEPAIRNRNPVSTVVTIEYSFSMY